MKQSLKNETDMLESINKIQALLIMLDKKVDALIKRPSSDARLPLTPTLSAAERSNNHNRERVMYEVICADCKKECKIPFKPSEGRPVYCQDCFSRRKVIKMSGMTVTDKPKEAPPLQAQVMTKKKAAAVKKPVGKKKPAPKKK